MYQLVNRTLNAFDSKISLNNIAADGGCLGMDYILCSSRRVFQTNGGNCMNKFMTMAQRFRDDEDGAAMVEYTILLGIITAATIASVVAVGVWVSSKWSAVETAIGA
jgi:pilus assembly protein Flp/PilA